MATPIKELTQKFHHAQILEKCKHLFYNRRLEDVTSDEISQFAGYSKRTVYIYFKSKQDIFEQVTDGAIDLFCSKMRETEFANLTAFLLFIENFQNEHEKEYYYLIRRSFDRGVEKDYYVFSEKFRPLLNLLADKHNFILTNLDVPLMLWNSVCYGLRNEVPLPTIEKYVLEGI